MGRREHTWDSFGARVSDIRKLFREALPLGFSGLLVAIYDSMAVIMLSKIADFRSVAYFSSSLRVVFPMVIIVQSIGNTVYPLLSFYWKKEIDHFTKTQQRALELSFFVVTGMFCVLNASAEFLMRIMGMEVTEAAQAASVLRFLACGMLARTVTAIMAPTIIVAGKQNNILWLVTMGVTLNAISLFLLIPKYGAKGAAIGYMMSELVVGMVPTIWISQHLTGLRMQWGILMRMLLASTVALWACYLIGLMGTLLGGLIAIILYLVIAIALRAISIKKLRQFIKEAIEGIDPLVNR